MHLTRGDIKELFNRELKTNSSDSPEELTMIARRVLRQKYIHATLVSPVRISPSRKRG